MPQTLTVAQALVGGFAGGGPMPEEVVVAARSALARAVEAGVLWDAHAHAHGSMLAVVLSHEAGEGDGDVQRAAWDALAAAADAARDLKLHRAGHGFTVDAFPGTLAGTGVASTELVLAERPSESVVVLLGAGAPAGALNAPLVRAFADPFSTQRLATPRMRRGFMFEVHDAAAGRKAMFAAPADLYELAACLAEPGRYAIRRVVTAEGIVAASASAGDPSGAPGGADAAESPVTLVRAEGDFPAVREVIAAFAGLAGVAALEFQVSHGRLVGPSDGASAGPGGRTAAAEIAEAEPPGGNRWSEI
jgi:fructose 1,6-bisphosphatase